jgi:hypothetical protein
MKNAPSREDGLATLRTSPTVGKYGKSGRFISLMRKLGRTDGGGQIRDEQHEE